jgi:hypothetical protein
MRTYAPNVRKIGKEFAEWINSGDKAAKLFLQLTHLTVDLAMELRNPIRRRNGKMGELAATVELLDRRTAEAKGREYVRPGREHYERAKTVVRFAGKIDPILQQIVRKYPCEPRLGFDPDRDDVPLFDDAPVYSGKRGYNRTTGVFDETFPAEVGMSQFRLLADHAAFADFRRCALSTCNKYFFPLRSEGLYCSKGCQSKHYRQDPERKKQNAADQKVYYYTQMVLDLAKLAAKNPTYQKQHHRAEKQLTLAKAKRDALKRRLQ